MFTITESIPVVITPNNTSPTIIVGPVSTTTTSSSSSSTAEFSISIVELREEDPSKQPVRSLPISAINFTLATVNSTYTYTATDLFQDAPLANLTITFAYYSYAYNYSFAGQNVSLTPGSVKLSVEVSNWPFANLHNRLSIISKTGVPQVPSGCGPSNTANNPNGNLVWVTSVYSGLTLYGSFLQDGIADGMVVGLLNSFDATTAEATMSLPHFWDYGSMF